MAEGENLNNNKFHIIDYIIFVLVIGSSTIIGILWAIYKNPKKEPDETQQNAKNTGLGSEKMNEYLLGSRQMQVLPVAMSLAGSYISGVTVLGTAPEIYNYGTQYWLIILPIALHAVVISKVYLPVFCKLRVGSSYEYLELRFNSNVRTFASMLFLMDELFFLPMVLYVPSIAFNHVTGINMHVVSSTIVVAVVLYTVMGGIKTVVHTNAWQMLILFLAMLIIVIIGTIHVSSLGSIFTHAHEGGRLELFNFNPSFYKRQTFWGILIGGWCYWTGFNSINQTMVQRYMSLPTLRDAQMALFIFTISMIIFVSLCCFAGLLVYDYFRYCDPFKADIIKYDDQLVPAYVMHSLGKYPGLPGLFIAGVFGAALSSLSVVLNSTALVILEDIFKGYLQIITTDRKATLIVKGSIIALGFEAFALVFVLEKLDGILSVGISFTAIACATTFGMFTLGMLVPWCNVIGAFAGAIAGLFLSGWISFGSKWAYNMKYLKSQKLETSVDNCTLELTMRKVMEIDESGVFFLYRLSFHWIVVFGLIAVLLVGTIVSFLTGPTKLKELDPDLISPVIHRFLPKEIFPPA